ncbi:hypothetical protein HX858_09465, partial [Marine Group I thaumarchaeote]|nr:hypothetical protein [Marine Group I thaumarchaeote]
MKIREVQIEDYIQIKELHDKYNLKILDKVGWSKFWLQDPCMKNSQNTFHMGWVAEEN